MEPQEDKMLVKWPEVEVPELLPDGWACGQHSSGVSYYYYEDPSSARGSRTVAWSKPYAKFERNQVKKHKPPLSIFQGLLLGRETELEQHYNQKEDEEEEHKPDHPDADGDVFLRRHHIDSAGKALQLKIAWLAAETILAQKSLPQSAYKDFKLCSDVKWDNISKKPKISGDTKSTKEMPEDKIDYIETEENIGHSLMDETSRTKSDEMLFHLRRIFETYKYLKQSKEGVAFYPGFAEVIENIETLGKDSISQSSIENAGIFVNPVLYGKFITVRDDYELCATENKEKEKQKKHDGRDRVKKNKEQVWRIRENIEKKPSVVIEWEDYTANDAGYKKSEKTEDKQSKSNSVKKSTRATKPEPQNHTQAQVKVQNTSTTAKHKKPDIITNEKRPKTNRNNTNDSTLQPPTKKMKR